MQYNPVANAQIPAGGEIWVSPALDARMVYLKTDLHVVTVPRTIVSKGWSMVEANFWTGTNRSKQRLVLIWHGFLFFFTIQGGMHRVNLLLIVRYPGLILRTSRQSILIFALCGPKVPRQRLGVGHWSPGGRLWTDFSIR